MESEVYEIAIQKAKTLMYEQTIKNKAPSWLLTELTQEVGAELSEKFNVNKNIVLLTLYLQHLVFDPIVGGKIQSNHPELSAKYVTDNNLLEKWNIPLNDRSIIIEAIKSHHKKNKSENLIVEVIKNAECQKFVTVKGALIWLHELGLRGYDFEKAKELVFYKMNQKKSLLTLEECKKIGEINCNNIIKLFNDKDMKLKLFKLHSLGLRNIEFKQAIKESDLLNVISINCI